MVVDSERLIVELEAAHLIRALSEPEPTFIFNHVLVQESAYQSLLLKGRREYHRLIAAAFEQEYADRLDEYSPTLAFHYWRGEDWRQAADYARRAGARAMRVYGLREAIGYYAQALQALDRIPDAAGEDICDVILGWADAAFGFEPFPKLLEHLERAEQIARQLGDKRRLAMLLLMIGKVHVASGHASRAEAQLAECFALATELGDDRLAVIPSHFMGMATQTSDPHGALNWFDRAVELARKYNDIDTLAYALGAKAMVEARLGEDVACRRNMQESLELVPSIQSPMADSDVHLFAGWSYLDLGDNRRAVEYARLGVDKALSADNMECACFAFACLGFGHLRTHQTGEAVQAFEEAVRRSKISGAEEAALMGQMGLGMVQFSSGHPEAVQDVENALAHARDIGDEFVGALLSQTLGEMYLERGEVQTCITFLTDALQFYRRHGMRPYLSRALELLATALERQGDREKANQARAERAELKQI